IAHELWPQRAQMHHASAADERADEANHEINRVVGRQNAKVANSWPEWVPCRQRLALLQIIIMREHASFGPPAGAGRIDDAGDIRPPSRNKFRIALTAEIFPAIGPRKIGSQRRFRD